MNEQKFDPMTGQPINQAAPKFDPMTGQPLNQQGGFDPMTGQPLNQAAPAQGTPMQGVNQQPYGYQQPYGAGQQPGNYGYNNMAAQHNQSQKNNKVAVIVLIVLVIALIGILGFVGFQASKILGKSDVEGGLQSGQNQEAEVVPLEPVENNEDQEEAKEDTVTNPEAEVEENNDEAGEAASIETSQPEETPVEETPTEENTLGSENTDAPVERAEVDASSAFAFSLGDKSYQVPFKFQELIEDGWKFYSDTDQDIQLEAGRGEYIYMICPGDTDCNLSMTVTNFSLNTESIKNGYVTEITLFSHDATKLGKKITMHGGDLVIGESKEADLKAAFGEPSRTNEDSISKTLWYDFGDERDYEHDQKVYFSIDENGVVDYASIDNDVEPENFEQVEVSTDAPAYLSQYKEPTELGTDPFSGNFELDGKLYNLPVPLQLLVDNGWEHGIEDETTVGAGQGYIITLRKNYVSMTCTVYNCGDTATILRNTIVTGINTSSSSIFDNGLKLPDGLNAHMTESELIDYLKKHNITNYEHNNSYNKYEIPFDQTGNDRSASGNRYTITINDDGTIDDIDIDNYGWTVK
ncbi:MAG: hypothetical protein K6G06_09225 [Butyrivibrio sp.]|nr:hypothetical protein [Butyrivibrio sp.]